MTKAFATWMLVVSSLPPATPLAFVERSVSQVVSVIQRIGTARPSGLDRHCLALHQATAHLFDFRKSARRVLTEHWDGRSQRERQEFVRLFTELLERTYVNQIGDGPPRKIVYVAESVARDSAAVRSKIVGRTRSEVLVDYELTRGDRGWGVYDIRVNGLGLIDVYRDQFTQILEAQSFARLLERVRSMLAEQTAQPSVAGRCPLLAS